MTRREAGYIQFHALLILARWNRNAIGLDTLQAVLPEKHCISRLEELHKASYDPRCN